MKTVVILFISLILFLPFLVSADTAPRAEWEKNIGGNREDLVYDIAETSDGGYIAAGKTLSLKAYEEVYVIKLDSSGNVEWEKTYGGTKKDYANSIRQTDDGGYIIGGGTSSFNVGVVDYYILKLDRNGEVQWTKTFGGTQTDICEVVIQTKDGGYMAAGQSWLSFQDGNIYLIKMDSSGKEEWSKSIGGSLEDTAYDIQQTPDMGYIIAGHTRTGTDGSYNAYIVKTDSAGNPQWKSAFGGNNDDQVYAIEQLRNGYVAAGYTKSRSSQEDVYVIKLDLDGNREWDRSYGGGETSEMAMDITKTSDGGFVLTGKTSQYTFGAFDAMLMKIDGNGNEQWSQVFGGENNDIGYSVLQTRDKKFVMAGQTKSIGYGGDAYVVKTEVSTGDGGTVDNGELPDYGSPANGILFSLMVLFTAGLILRRR